MMWSTSVDGRCLQPRQMGSRSRIRVRCAGVKPGGFGRLSQFDTSVSVFSIADDHV
jgi:hypothetical protein